jgi:hypothetical protein
MVAEDNGYVRYFEGAHMTYQAKPPLSGFTEFDAD